MNEAIKINGKILQYGVLSDNIGYQMYTYPGMTVAELAFNIMVTIKLLVSSGSLTSKEEFDNLVTKYYNDPQYEGKIGEVENGQN